MQECPPPTFEPEKAHLNPLVTRSFTKKTPRPSRNGITLCDRKALRFQISKKCVLKVAFTGISLRKHSAKENGKIRSQKAQG